MNKQSIWFLTLFSLVLVLSVYYITMPSELLLQNNSNVIENDPVINEVEENNVEVVIEEAEEIVALRVSHEEEILSDINSLEAVMLDDEKTTNEKNEAYEQIKYLKSLKSKEEELEKLIKNTYKLDSFIEVDNNSIKVTCASTKHDVALANNIMKTLQEQFKEKKYITVRFN